MIKTDEQLIEEYKHAKYMEAQCNTSQMVAKVLINSLKS